MRYTGKCGWKASYKDTWSLDSVLDPIITAALIKFKEVITSKERGPWAGLPSAYVTWEGDREDDTVFDRQLSVWHNDIDKMIYAFSAEEPDYTGGWEAGPNHGDVDSRGYRRHNMLPKDQKAYDGVRKAEKIHHEAVVKGRALFAEHYNSLWW